MHYFCREFYGFEPSFFGSCCRVFEANERLGDFCHLDVTAISNNRDHVAQPRPIDLTFRTFSPLNVLHPINI